MFYSEAVGVKFGWWQFWWKTRQRKMLYFLHRFLNTGVGYKVRKNIWQQTVLEFVSIIFSDVLLKSTFERYRSAQRKKYLNVYVTKSYTHKLHWKDVLLAVYDACANYNRTLIWQLWESQRKRDERWHTPKWEVFASSIQSIYACGPCKSQNV